jgi:hypothetical protein
MDMEQGKKSLRLDKVNQVLYMFGHVMEPVPVKRGGDDETSGN